ncbi:MAG: diguanylate cyclase [Syntrophus sp. (in: bacteria)]
MKDQSKSKQMLIQELASLRQRMAERELSESGTVNSGFTFEGIFRENDAIMLLINGEDGRLIDANNAALRFYGYSIHQIKLLNVGDISKLPAKELDAERQRALMEGRKHFIVPHQLANGSIRIVEVHTTQANKTFLFSIIHDITERKQAEEKISHLPEDFNALSPEEKRQILHELRVHQIELEMQNEELRQSHIDLDEARARYFDLYDLAPVCYLTLSEQGLILEANLTTATLLGVTKAALLKQRLTRFIIPDDQGIYYQHRKDLFETGAPQTCLMRVIRNDANPCWVRVDAVVVKDTDSAPVCRAVLIDITDRKKLEEELLEASLHDLLTGLHNRRGFFALAEQQVKEATRAKMNLSLTYFDCDDFKWINDSLGHEQGDRVLIDTAYILRQNFRESDIIARIGGDEFVVLSIEAADIDPEVFLKRLQQNIDEYNEKETRRYKLALSWGTVVYNPESPGSLDELLSQADRLMYIHKKDKANKQS